MGLQLPSKGGSAAIGSSSPLRAGVASPGASSKAAAEDHVHPAQLLSDFSDLNLVGATDGQILTYDGASGKVIPKTASPALIPLWQGIDAGEVTLPRGHLDDSGSYGQTPGSGQMRVSYFRAQNTGTRNTVRFQTAGTAAAGSTIARVGIYSVAADGALTLLAGCTNKTTFGGTYAGQSCVLTAGVALTAGVVYALGILQVATTPGTLLGAWFNPASLGGVPRIATQVGSLSDLPASVAAGSLSTSAFPIYAEIV